MSALRIKHLSAAVALAGLAIVYSAPSAAVEHNGGDFTVVATATADPTVVQFVYTADFDGWTGNTDFIFAVAFKLEGYEIAAGGVDLTGTTAPGTWVEGFGPSNANGCQGDNDTWACAEDGFSAPTTGSYTWTFLVTFTDDVDPDDFASDTNSIQARFYDCEDPNNPTAETCQAKEGLSENTSFGDDDTGGDDDDDTGGDDDVPEPGTLGLMGMALLGLGLARRRRSLK